MAGDFWLSDGDASALARVLRIQRAVNGNRSVVTPKPVRLYRYNVVIGVDEQGRKFVFRDPTPEIDIDVLAPQEVQRARAVDDAGVNSSIVDSEDFRSRLRGSLLAGAIGDALGAPIENQPMEYVTQQHGPRGIVGFVPAYDGLGTITDDTQMTLFTLEGLIRAHVRQRVTGESNLLESLQMAYQRWLFTQKVSWANCRGPKSDSEEPDGWLVTLPGLHRRRGPGATCFFALKEFGKTGQIPTFAKPANNSKGCGGVMRAAPAALWSPEPSEVFTVAATAAAVTHSHPSGYLSAGALAVVVHQLLRGKGLTQAIDRAVTELVGWDGNEETVSVIEQAIGLAGAGRPSPERVRELGAGNVGESALAIGLYAALSTETLREALLTAVNHDGDSDSTGSVCGNIVGAHYGFDAVRVELADLVDGLEHRDVIERMIADAVTEFSADPPTDDEWLLRYPTT